MVAEFKGDISPGEREGVKRIIARGRRNLAGLIMTSGVETVKL
jgi:hypothetical protein